MRKLLLLSVFICTPAFADPINAPRAAQIIASQPQAEASFDPEITGTISNKEKARRARAQHRQQEERPDFADNRPGAARPGSMGGGFIEFLFSGAQRGELPRSSAQRPWEDCRAISARRIRARAACRRTRTISRDAWASIRNF